MNRHGCVYNINFKRIKFSKNGGTDDKAAIVFRYTSNGE